MSWRLVKSVLPYQRPDVSYSWGVKVSIFCFSKCIFKVYTKLHIYYSALREFTVNRCCRWRARPHLQRKLHGTSERSRLTRRVNYPSVTFLSHCQISLVSPRDKWRVRGDVWFLDISAHTHWSLGQMKLFLWLLNLLSGLKPSLPWFTQTRKTISWSQYYTDYKHEAWSTLQLFSSQDQEKKQNSLYIMSVRS